MLPYKLRIIFQPSSISSDRRRCIFVFFLFNFLIISLSYFLWAGGFWSFMYRSMCIKCATTFQKSRTEYLYIMRQSTKHWCNIQAVFTKSDLSRPICWMLCGAQVILKSHRNQNLKLDHQWRNILMKVQYMLRLQYINTLLFPCKVINNNLSAFRH